MKKNVKTQDIGVKVVGSIDLDSINTATRPVKKTKEERDEERQRGKEVMQAYNRELIIRSLTDKRDRLQQQVREAAEEANGLRQRVGEAQQDERRTELQARLARLLEKQALREHHDDLSLGNDERQKELSFFGIRPKRMDAVHFHVPKTKDAEEMDGVALARDENHYYLAVDLYDQPDQEDNATTMMDVNPDGTFEGIWPRGVVLKPAQRFEERFIRALTDKYADDLEHAEEFVASVKEQEASDITLIRQELAAGDAQEKELAEAEERARKLNGDLLAADAELRRYRQEAEEDAAAVPPAADTEALGFTFADDAEYEPAAGLGLDTPAEQKYAHLPYLRGTRQMLTMNWPAIDQDYMPWLRFRLMSNIARMVMMLRKVHALTYVLTDEYYEELSRRGREHYKGMKIEELVPAGETAFGAVVYPCQGHQDTILYYVDNRELLTIIVAYLREDRLMFYESYSMQEVIARPRTDHFICQSLRDSGTDPSRLFGWIRNLVVAHLAMESDMGRVVRLLVEEEKGSATETDILPGDAVDTADDHDVVLRDAAWYTELTVNREIPVRGYLSHRWCGSGKDRYIREVWVRPYVKQGYHRKAGVKK